MGKGNFCPFNHFKAISYRKLVLYKRSLRFFLTTIIGIVGFSLFSIGVQYLMTYLMRPIYKPVNFNSYTQVQNDFLIVGNENSELATSAINYITKAFKQDTGEDAIFHYYDSLELMNKDLYNSQVSGNYKMKVPFGLDFSTVPNNLTLIYNQTTNREIQSVEFVKMYGHTLLGQLLWKLDFGDSASFTVGYMPLLQKRSELIFSMVGPMLIMCGLMTIIPLFITQPVSDITGEVRQYMIQSGLRIFPYWLATFLLDFATWTITVTLAWGILCAGQIQSFLDNMLNTWYLFVFQGPSFILCIYDFSFLFANANSASRQTFLIAVVTLLVPMIINVIVTPTPLALHWFYSLFPTMSLMNILGMVLLNGASRKHNISYYWKEKTTFPYFIMEFIDAIIYAIILLIIEMNRLSIQRKMAKSSFSNFTDYLKKLKARHHSSNETLEMEEEVHNSHDFAVRVENVSRLFINAAGEPVAAVNCVSLGVKEGSIFGFLGANGAGKTTLIRMITGSLPSSDGTIEIFGTLTEDIKDPTIISICPQFNTHLFMEMTPKEHFYLYGLLFEMDKEENDRKINQLMEGMGLMEFINKPLHELSGGDVRKLAIALTFFGPSRLVLLDEPTASLDPVACRCVHEMILENKSNKTFMLCTHLLSEAETLCDKISIMVRGNVFTVGTPAYLTKKFGTEYKIDVMLKDESEEEGEKCDAFFSEQLPQAKLSMKRPKARIYSIPADLVTLPVLFEKMQSGADGDNGITYYTCSSSSLERVFMEIVAQSEQEQDQGAIEDEMSETEKKEKENELEDIIEDKSADSEKSKGDSSVSVSSIDSGEHGNTDIPDVQSSEV